MSYKIKEYIKKEKVLVISFICAALTVFFVPFDKAYIGYIDFRVLSLLFSLMAVVAGMEKCGAFKAMASKLMNLCKSGKALGAVLVMLPFFSSMLLTNDVSLLTFVPFTLMLLKNINCEKAVIPTLVLQTVAANLGSMATPVGNPQNLFLYSRYELSAGEFFACMVPLTLVSFICLLASSFFLLPKTLPSIELSGKVEKRSQLLVYIGLFFLCLMTVFRILPYKIMTALVAVVIFLMDRKLLKNLDYALLLTFVCFFTVSGNLGRIEEVSLFLNSFLSKSTLLTSIGASQIISNVPAAVLLSSFTDNWKALLEGVNIGGLGTPVASLASLITLKIYMAEKDSSSAKFIKFFTLANVLGLVILTLFASIR